MNICVFGASGPVGRAVVTQALGAGHQVTAVTRRPDRFALSGPRLRVVTGDVLDLPQVETCVEGADAVISVIGVNPSRGPITTYSEGIGNVMAAMRAQGISRIACVSSKALTEGGTRHEPIVYRLLVARLLAAVNRSLYDDMRRMEALVRKSELDWTIVRPAGLYAAARVSTYRCTTAEEPGVFSSTADVADALIREVTGERPHIGAVVQVLTDEETPPYLVLLARQASLHRR